MLTPLVAGVFALAGVLLGAFLEPVKARVAARTRLREERALRSAQLVEAATTDRDAALWLFRTVRTVAPPVPATAELVAEADRALRTLWFDRDPDTRQSHSVEMSEVLHRGRDAFDAFTDLARRLTTPA